MDTAASRVASSARATWRIAEETEKGFYGFGAHTRTSQARFLVPSFVLHLVYAGVIGNPIKTPTPKP